MPHSITRATWSDVATRSTYFNGAGNRETSAGAAARRQAHEVAVGVDVEFRAAGRAEFVLVALPRLAAHLAREAGFHQQHKLEGGAVNALAERVLLARTGLSSTGAPVFRGGEERRRHGQRAQVGEQRPHL